MFTYTERYENRITYVPVDWIMQNLTNSVDCEAERYDERWFAEYGWMNVIQHIIQRKVGNCAEHIVTIQELGFCVPIVIVVNEDHTFMLGNGHHRLVAAILLCLNEIPVYFSWGKGYMVERVSDPDGGADLVKLNQKDGQAMTELLWEVYNDNNAGDYMS